MPAALDDRWQSYEVNLLHQMVRDGCTARVIAIKLCRSRNSVIARAHRDQLIWSGHQRPAKPKGPRGKRPMRKKPTIQLIAPTATDRPPDFAVLVDLHELGKFQCRWPYGDSAPYKFCGAPKQHEESYCPWHKRASIRGGGGL